MIGQDRVIASIFVVAPNIGGVDSSNPNCESRNPYDLLCFCKETTLDIIM
jgi:hypothetical protein